MGTNDRRGRDTIRELARQRAELANSAENAQRQKRWRAVNSLLKTDRPPVVCHPGTGAWDELLPKTTLVSQDTDLRALELQLRRSLYKWEIGDDTVLDPGMPVSTVVRLEGEHLWGLPVRLVHPDSKDAKAPTRTAYRYDPPLREETDIERIVPPRYRLDREATDRKLTQMNDLLGDALPIYEVCTMPYTGWLHGWASQLRGVEQLLFDLMDRPAWVHRLMTILRDGVLGTMSQFERMGALTLNNTFLMGCDDLPQPDFNGRVRVKDLWGRGESQEFQGVSPAQFEEFLLQHQKPILKRYGLTFYGCCEDLTNKIAMVLSIPNLRRFVCSPWTDLGKVVNAVGTRTCIEWRQKATDVVHAPDDLSTVRKHLENGLRLARDSHIMIVLQELETVSRNPRRLPEWAKLAREIGGGGWPSP